MKIGDAVKVKDLPLASAAGITLISDPEAVVVRVTPVRGGEVPERKQKRKLQNNILNKEVPDGFRYALERRKKPSGLFCMIGNYVVDGAC